MTGQDMIETERETRLLREIADALGWIAGGA